MIKDFVQWQAPPNVKDQSFLNLQEVQTVFDELMEMVPSKYKDLVDLRGSREPDPLQGYSKIFVRF